jgi:tocopherol O-methyltransferase
MSVDFSLESIQRHYDRCSFFYEKLWGSHIHHGLWENGESVSQAQVKLIERLAQAARIPVGANILDAGCGLGGSSLWLARERQCRVLGVTLSPVQARLARRRMAREGLDGRVRILRADLEALDLRLESLDAVWSIECTEHLRDKGAFIRKAARALRPGGVMAVCAWTPADGLPAEDHRRWIGPICRGFLCPSLAEPRQYTEWMREGGLSMIETADLTGKTARTWEICLERTRPFWVRAAARLLGPDTRRFLDSFPVILEAYRSGVLRYTLFAARKENPA